MSWAEGVRRGEGAEGREGEEDMKEAVFSGVIMSECEYRNEQDQRPGPYHLARMSYSRLTSLQSISSTAVRPIIQRMSSGTSLLCANNQISNPCLIRNTAG